MVNILENGFTAYFIFSVILCTSLNSDVCFHCNSMIYMTIKLPLHALLFIYSIYFCL